MKKNVREIEQTAISGIALLIGEFSELYTARIVDRDIGALDAIEEDWANLRNRTDRIYQQMVSELTDAVDEREMIAKKKLNGVSKG
jgi:hypothetical protein